MIFEALIESVLGMLNAFQGDGAYPLQWTMIFALAEYKLRFETSCDLLHEFFGGYEAYLHLITGVKLFHLELRTHEVSYPNLKVSTLPIRRQAKSSFHKKNELSCHPVRSVKTFSEGNRETTFVKLIEMVPKRCVRLGVWRKFASR